MVCVCLLLVGTAVTYAQTDALPGDASSLSPPRADGKTPTTIRAPTRTPERRTLALAMTTWAGAVTSDQITTYQFSSGYRDTLHETNPLLRPLDRRPALLVTAGAALDASSGWVVYRLLGRKHPRLATLAFAGAALYRGYLARYNLGMMRQARAHR
jgi:hypothetical protein